MATRLVMYVPPLFYCAWLWWLSDQPNLDTTGVNDKLAHVLAFGLLGVLAVRAFWFATDWSALRVGVGGVAWGALYGVVDEIHQSFVPGRDASGFDMAADALGAVLGAGVMLTMYLTTGRLAYRPRS